MTEKELAAIEYLVRIDTGVPSAVAQMERDRKALLTGLKRLLRERVLAVKLYHAAKAVACASEDKPGSMVELSFAVEAFEDVIIEHTFEVTP